MSANTLPPGITAILAQIDAAETVSPPTAPAASSPPPDAGRDEVAADDGGFDVDRMNERFAHVLMGAGARILKVQVDGPIEERERFITVDAFRSLFANRFVEVRAPDGSKEWRTWANAWLRHRERRDYDGIEFFPNPDGAPATSGYFNLWRGFAVEPRPGGSYAIFRDHLLNNVCRGDRDLFAYVWAWLAHLVQRPRERIGVALVLRGKRGAGKTKVGEVVGSLVRWHYFLIDDPRYVTGQFNAHLGRCLLLQADEATWAGDKATEGRLKGLITADHQMIEHKGVDPIRMPNFVRLIMTSNEDWVVPAGKDERRFCVLDVHDRCAQHHEYFAEMDEQLAGGGREALLHDLLRVDLAGINLRQAPRTSGLLEQKLRTLNSVEGWWYERLVDGSPTRAAGDDWPREVSTEAMFHDYVRASDEVGIRRRAERTAFGIAMRRLVPDIVRVRGSTEASPGVITRTWLYRLPPLAECREAFEAAVEQPVGWDRPGIGDDQADETR